jgi:hypothetical protein
MVFHGEISRTPGNRLLTEHIDVLRAAFVYVKSKHPYYVEAVLVLPEQLTLPDGDSDLSTRWGLIKTYFSRHIETGEQRSTSRERRGERGLYPGGASGSGAFGSILFEMKPIIDNMLIAYIGIRPNISCP